jgi:hypothetical protein
MRNACNNVSDAPTIFPTGADAPVLPARLQSVSRPTPHPGPPHEPDFGRARPLGAPNVGTAGPAVRPYPVQGCKARRLVSGNSLPVEGRGGAMGRFETSHTSSRVRWRSTPRRRRLSAETSARLEGSVVRVSLSPQRGEGRGEGWELRAATPARPPTLRHRTPRPALGPPWRASVSVLEYGSPLPLCLRAGQRDGGSGLPRARTWGPPATQPREAGIAPSAATA